MMVLDSAPLIGVAAVVLAIALVLAARCGSAACPAAVIAGIAGAALMASGWVQGGGPIVAGFADTAIGSPVVPWALAGVAGLALMWRLRPLLAAVRSCIGPAHPGLRTHATRK